MKKLLLFAAVAGLGLVSASPPPKGPEVGPGAMRHHYPPCSRTVTDRCIQLYERGVRARAERDDYARDDREDMGRGDDMRGGHRWRRDRYAEGDHRWRRDRDGDGERHWRRYQIADDRDGDGDHRWCREHHAHHGVHRERLVIERVIVRPRPVRPMAMAARAARVVGCRCAPAPRRQVAQHVRRAGERG